MHSISKTLNNEPYQCNMLLLKTTIYILLIKMEGLHAIIIPNITEGKYGKILLLHYIS